MKTTTESPCIGICSTVYGDNICRGCKRNFLEVIHWNRYQDSEKQRVNQRLEQQIQQVVSEFLIIEDATKLKLAITQVALRALLYENPFYWAYELLRLKAKQIDHLESYGIRAKPPYHTLSSNGLFTQIDDAIYTLAQQTPISTTSA